MAKIQGVHVPAELKNLAINGNMDFFQRIEGNTTTVNATGSANGYTADMFSYAYSATGTAANFSIASNSAAPSLAQSGFNSTNSYLFTMITGRTFSTATDHLQPIVYIMEGLDYARIHSKTVTFSFWMQASVAGTYSFALRNQASNRSYVTTFTINGANTWQFITIPITLDNTGTWVFTTAQGLFVNIAAITGSSFQTSVLNQWQSGNFFMASNATLWAGTTGATFNIVQFSIVEGPLGFGATGFLRAGKDMQQELAMCQRYYQKTYAPGIAPGATSQTLDSVEFLAQGANSDQRYFPFKTTMRAAPTVTTYSANSGASGKAYDVTGAVDVTWLAEDTGMNGSGFQSGLTATHIIRFHYAAEAGL